MRRIARAMARVLIGAWLSAFAPVVSAQSPATDAIGLRTLTAEERAYYEAQREALVAYVECLKAHYVADRETTPTNAAGACAAERSRYSAYLPEDLVALELDILDYRIATDLERE
jgi:hypothetical protein